MKLFPVISTLLALAAAPAIASAANVVVDFENNWAYGQAVDNTYASSGVTFTNVLGASNDADFTYYTNAPSPLGVAYVQLNGEVNTTAYMNVDAGVDSSITFSYSSLADVVGAVKAYSGLNGTGTLLGTFNLTANATTSFDVWTAATFAYSGVAKSFDLSATNGAVGLDNIAITPVPEASTGLMVLFGAIPVIAGLRRRRA
jgi:hypothetical protein